MSDSDNRTSSGDDFSILDPADDSDSNPSIPGAYPLNSHSLKSRLWHVFQSPSRSPSSRASSPERSSPSRKRKQVVPIPSLGQSWYTHLNNRNPTSAIILNGKGHSLFSSTKKQKHRNPKSKKTPITPPTPKPIDYKHLPPLDGEEGELIDDEACYFVGSSYEPGEDNISEHKVTGLDILTNLPQELSLHILTLLSPPLSLSSISTTGIQSPPAISSSPSTHSQDRDSQIQLQLSETPLQTILSCRLVSRSWCKLASDNQVWKALFCGRWSIDLRRAGSISLPIPSMEEEEERRCGVEEFLVDGLGTRQRQRQRPLAMQLGRTWYGYGWFQDASADQSKARHHHHHQIRSASSSSSGSGTGTTKPLPIPQPEKRSKKIPLSTSPLLLDWRVLYRERLELERRWEGKPGCVALREFGVGAKDKDVDSDWDKVQKERYEPKPMRIVGHSDSVYCLEFDSRRIITGSRDKKIKVWSLKTGKLLGTFEGKHTGSVLCLKFEKDWERGWVDDDEDDEEEGQDEKPGFMVSGSSDCTVCVWDLYLGDVVRDDGDDKDDGRDGVETEGEGGGGVVAPSSDVSTSTSTITRRKLQRRKTIHEADESEREVKAEVRATLRGHSQGVLDLRIDRKWIVSCSKDAVIRVWDRKTLELYRVLRGHEGPVNAVGLQSGRVVSASGDGKLILWDIESGERLRTFEGHNRGLACIEYKGDLIVSGSNDCKIKLWSASTGECLRDLTGHSALVRALSFDPRSGRLVSASYDRSIKVWDLRCGSTMGGGGLVREFRGVDVHTSHIFDVKFDVGRIVSTSHDQKIVVHDFSVGLDTSLFV